MFFVLCFGWEYMFLVGGILGIFVVLLIMCLLELLCWLIGKGCFDEVEYVIWDIEVSMFCCNFDL